MNVQSIFCILIVIVSNNVYSHMLHEESEVCLRSREDEALKQSCNIYSTVKRFLFYDVNPPEGFNLRRDVFMRIAVLTKKLRKFGDWTLVLPPWDELYHWKSVDVGEQSSLPWRMFFDLDSIRDFIPVRELDEYIKEYGSETIDEVYFLQHYKDTWENKDWEDKMDIAPCHGILPYRLNSEGLYNGEFWGIGDTLKAKRVRCLSFQGPASYMIPLLLGGKRVAPGKKGWKAKPNSSGPRSVMIDRAEVALHDEFGNAEYWRARRSMRFASHLVSEAIAFREKFLNSTDEKDNTVRPSDWRMEKPPSTEHSESISEKGGPYLCVHLRRQDFIWGRSSDVPSLKWAAHQVMNHLKSLGLFVVFLATDAPHQEVAEFRGYFGANFSVRQWKPTKELKMKYKDGGVAIIDQIICSHARFFIGTHESTFTFRIQEEREIMGFDPDTTFNRLCGQQDEVDDNGKKHKKKRCEKPSRWRIVF